MNELKHWLPDFSKLLHILLAMLHTEVPYWQSNDAVFAYIYIDNVFVQIENRLRYVTSWVW